MPLLRILKGALRRSANIGGKRKGSACRSMSMYFLHGVRISPRRQVEALNERVQRRHHGGRWQDRKDRVLGRQNPRVQDQEEPQGALFAHEHRSPPPRLPRWSAAWGSRRTSSASSPSASTSTRPSPPSRCAKATATIAATAIAAADSAATVAGSAAAERGGFRGGGGGGGGGFRSGGGGGGGFRRDREGATGLAPRPPREPMRRRRPTTPRRATMTDVTTIPARRPFHRRRKTCPFSGDKRTEDRLQGYAPARAATCPSAARSCRAASRLYRPRSSGNWPGPSSARFRRAAALRDQVAGRP